MLEWNGDEARQQFRGASAEALLRVAVFYETQHKLRLNVSNPRPYLNSSKEGEYPRARTGAGRSGVTHQPASIEQVAQEQAVRVGYLEPVKYMLILEIARNRKGLLATLDDLRPQLATLAKG